MSFNDFWLKLVGIILIILFVPFVIFGVEHQEGGLQMHLVGMIITAIHAIILWTGNKWIFYKTLASYPFGVNHKGFLLSMLIRVVGYTTIVVFIGFVFEYYFAPYEVTLNHVTKVWCICILISFAVLGLYFGIEIVESYNKVKEEREQLKLENSEARFQSLKKQMNPHFLFNSLNTLTSIIPSDPDKAVSYTEKLSKVYRYILEIKDRNLISIEEELKCVRAYIYMLKIRFEDSIQIEFDIPDKYDKDYIIPLSIQTLIENAVKHNVSSSKNPLHINIIVDDDHIKVCNKLKRINREYESSGIGLNNLNSRYELLIEKGIHINESDDKFCVSLPIININTYAGINS